MTRASNGWKRPDLLKSLKFAVSRLLRHSEGCKGGRFAYCRCSNAVAVRRLDPVIKSYDPEWPTEIENAEAEDRREEETQARRVELRANIQAKRDAELRAKWEAEHAKE